MFFDFKIVEKKIPKRQKAVANIEKCLCMTNKALNQENLNKEKRV
jgi:hypothetical protein